MDIVSIKMLTITERYEKLFFMWADSCLGKLEDYSIIIYEKKRQRHTHNIRLTTYNAHNFFFR